MELPYLFQLVQSNINIIIPEAKLDRLFCSANPTATPIAPIIVIKEDDGTPTSPSAAIIKQIMIIKNNT